MKDLEASHSWSLRGMLRESVRKSFLKGEVNRLVDDLSFERREVSDHAESLRVMLANNQIR